MKIFQIKAILILILGFCCLGLAGSSQAAKLYLTSELNTFGVGDEFNVNIKIDTAGESINASEVRIFFPNSVLELLDTDNAGSIFNFWLEGPTISNEDGEIIFIGGTPKGVAGGALRVLKLNFKAVGVGTAELVVSSDAVVAASDGKGTNILSAVEGLNIAVGTETLPAQPVVVPEGVAGETPVQPELVQREPVLALEKPGEPVLRIPLYPDQTKWYSHLGQTLVFWEVPDDIVKVATQIDRNPNGDPQNIDDQIFTGKNLGILDEGVWYAHVQFKNNVGWGKVAHYKISIDTTPPVPFEITIDNALSDNPTPAIKYESQDSLSGIAQYSIIIDGASPIVAEANSSVLPIQAPGKHTVRVRAVDLAGNSVEDGLEFEILPLPTPTIEFITKTIAQEDYIFVSGKTKPAFFVDVHLADSKGKEIFLGQTLSDELGNWETVIYKSLERGAHVLTANARDERGAVSYATAPQTIKVRPKTIISLGVVDLSWIEISIIGILIIISIVSLFAWSYVSAKKTRQAYRVVVGRDIDKLSDLMIADIKKMKEWFRDQKKILPPKEKADAEYLLNKVGDTAAKIKKYIPPSVNKLK